VRERERESSKEQRAWRTLALPGQGAGDVQRAMPQTIERVPGAAKAGRQTKCVRRERNTELSGHLCVLASLE